MNKLNIIISSKDNPIIKSVKKLKEKRYRDTQKKFIVEGLRFVKEAIESDFKVDYLFISEKNYKKFTSEGFIKESKKEVELFEVSESALHQICSTENPQGIAAVVEYKNIDAEMKDGFYILVDKVQDPGNMGTIIRTANAAGALGVIITAGTVDVYNSKTLRSTMGSIFKIPVIFEDKNLSKIKKLKENGFRIITSALEAKYNFYDVKLNGRLIITVGNEGNGVSDPIKKVSDLIVKIPMPGNAESLNVGVASAVMMFEYVRQMEQ